MRIALLGKNMGIYSLGNISLRAAAFLLIPIYTRYLSVDNYGLLDICIITMQILIIFMSLGMPQSLVRFYKEHEIKKDSGALYSSCFAINFAGCLILTAVILLLRNPLSQLIFDKRYSFILVLVCFISLARSLTQSSLSYFRAKNQALLYSATAVAIMLGLMALNILFVVVLGKGIIGILHSYLIVYALAAICISIFIFLKEKPGISKGMAKKLIYFGLPLIFSMSGWFIIQMSSRYFLVNYSGLNEVGIYGLGYRIVSILQIVIVMPFQLALGPFVFSQEEDPGLRSKLATILTYILMVLFTSTWLIGFLAKFIIKVIAPPEYREAHIVVLVMLPSIIAIGVYYWAANLLHLKKKTQWIGFFIASAALVNVGLNLWLIPKFGWYGAAVSTNVSILLAMMLNIIFGQKFTAVPIEKQRLYQLGFCFLFLSGILILSISLSNLAYYLVNSGSFIMIVILLYNSKFLHEKEKNFLKKKLNQIKLKGSG
jgi:O-antigen/teichoic acid export membrane protein